MSLPDMDAFVMELLRHVPELKDAYDEHINDNDELLAHLFFGDVARYVQQQVRSSALDSSGPVSRILILFEDAIINGTEHVQELIAVSFLENFSGLKKVAKRLRSFMGPNLRKQFDLSTGNEFTT